MTVKNGAFNTGDYRNIFKEIGYDNLEINRKIEDTWDKLFGDHEETKIYYEVGEDLAYMLDTGNIDVRTEGMSYGMMMAVQLNKKEVFDRLWKWTVTYMFMTEGENAGYFAWSCLPDGSRNSNGPAPDGEEYFALALLFASHCWGDGEEPFNYSQQAKSLLHTVLHKGEGGHGYPMWNLENKLIKFIPNCEFSDPSYHLPHFYELFSLWSNPEDRPFWKEAASASREYLKIACHPETGLAPEYAFYDGKPNHIRGFGHFYSDSYRVAANIGLDYEWFRGDEWEVENANRIQAFFADKKPADYRRYTVDGKPFEEKSLHPVGLLATNAMASLAADGEYAHDCVKLFWNTPVRTGKRRYYDNCLYMFSLLALSGNFKIWFPE
ncbi:glycosyl hydrolase family 8 [Evansella cellulosilytica]|uniref:Glycoside hydrolase family 8 n=1 Tax=Evansella cellulosilytica (strain ATCC 21833 / DSM 2522 / FERM P-1141 / JCM 9156 / N-4) TaxID=649639 RepID=E6TXK5_EVAC2|nr:glycosyl hydrolase family 8 [Evansella cellulosilytica]ADU28819.1 glycoside hydrolase family 8 [Evansella cellulosilytica DSM 2522]